MGAQAVRCAVTWVRASFYSQLDVDWSAVAPLAAMIDLHVRHQGVLIKRHDQQNIPRWRDVC